MANLTIAIDDEILKQARIRALEQGVSVNALLRDFLIHYVDPERNRERALQALHEIADRASTGSGGRTWTRDELHER